MRLFILKLSILFFLSVCSLSAQNWQLKPLAVDTSLFPKIAFDFLAFEQNAKPIKNISENSITIYDGDKLIPDFELDYVPSDATLKILILLDVSGSMRGSKFSDAKNSLKELFKVIDRKNQCALFTFGSDIRPISNFTSDFTFLIQSVDAIDMLSLKTRLYDGLLEGTSLFSPIENTRNVIILITDGKDEGSYSELEESIQSAKRNNVEVYSIGIGNDADIQTLGKISFQTGAGYSGRIQPSELRYVLQNIYEQLHKNYRVTFATPDSIVEIGSTRRKLGVGVTYKGFEKKATMEYVVPKYNPYTDYDWIILIVVGFILLSLILLIITIINNRSKHEEVVLESDQYFVGSDSSMEADDEMDYDADDETHLDDWEDEFRRNVEEQKTVLVSGGKYATENSLGYLVMRSKKFGMSVFEIRQRELVLGRATTCDILLEDEEVSKLHTKVRVVDGNFFVDDLGSSNGTLLNDEKVYHAELKDGDQIKIAEHEFVFKCIE